MITEARIRLINADFRGHHQVEVIKRQPGDTDASIERRAHVRAAEFLEDMYPGEWCYRYGEIDPHIVLPHGASREAVTGVGGINMIRDGGFKGQFQWNDYWRGGSNLVPATVDTVDPEREERYRIAREAQAIEDERARKTLYAKCEALPPFQPKDEEAAALWQSWAEVNQNTIFLYAENWARLAQAELGAIDGGFDPTQFAEIVERTSHEADVDGMSGATHGLAQQALVQAWVYGDALKAKRDGERRGYAAAARQ